MNLVQNAAESIGEKGQITLRSRRNRMVLNGDKTDAVVIEVEDTGPGIPAEVQERLFDPFFSTKENGTGLGLAIAARIVDKHEGALVFETQQGHGTTFGIVLPIERK
jgi:signal transduction histidine kinase